MCPWVGAFAYSSTKGPQRTRRAKTLVPSNTRGRMSVRSVDGLEQKRRVDRHLWIDCGQKLGEGGNIEPATSREIPASAE